MLNCGSHCEIDHQRKYLEPLSRVEWSNGRGTWIFFLSRPPVVWARLQIATAILEPYITVWCWHSLLEHADLCTQVGLHESMPFTVTEELFIVSETCTQSSSEHPVIKHGHFHSCFGDDGLDTRVGR